MFLDKFRLALPLLIFISCSRNVDCELDLVYKDGLTYFNNKLYSGNCNSFYLNGNKMNQQSYLKGMDNGVWNLYYENGKLETKGSYLNNKKHGEWQYFFNDGITIKQVSYYKNGLKDSIWVKYTIDGGTVWKREFKNDILIVI